MKLSIIIVSWNTRDFLAGCLHSLGDDLTALQRDEVETYVVDNASGDDSVTMIRQQFPWVHLIENQKNVGFAAANNQAIQHSRGRYVLLLNPDTKVLPGAISSLVSFLDANPEAGAAGARLFNGDGSLQTSCFPAQTLRRELWRLFYLDTIRPLSVYRMANWDVTTPQEVDVVRGACLIVRKSILDEVGLLDEEYFMYSEEVDLCARIQHAGWKLYWVPEARVIHYGSGSAQQAAPTMFLHFYKGKILYFRKHSGLFSAQVYKGILLIAALVRLLFSPLAYFEATAQKQRHFALAQHYWRLVLALPQM